MMNRLNLKFVRRLHVAWIAELEQRIRQGEPLPHIHALQECELTIWLQGEGPQELHHFDSVRALMNAHEQLHQVVNRIPAYLDSRAREEVATTLWQVHTLSRDIVYFLTELEFVVFEEHGLGQVVAHPIRSLVHKWFHVADREGGSEHDPLGINHARLMHLRWSRDLVRAFNHWGRNAEIESGVSCDLGNWIHGVGRQLDRGLVAELDKVHRLLHAKAEETIRALRRKNIRVSDKLYQEVVDLGREVLYLLTRIETLLPQSATAATRPLEGDAID
ncbi:MAG: CZB domain-containing protein [Magnetococcales bacterium]|nr:CZB domain-containing protein [Magnetococcales bacterium]